MQLTSVTGCVQADPDNISKVVLFPGDPLRAKFIAETYLTDIVQFHEVRNMLGFTGTYNGKRISVMGSGMGIPSACLYAEDLYNQYGVEAIIRVGSAGALSDDINLKDVVIAMSASTNSSYISNFPFPGTLAPTADWELFKSAVEVAEEKKITAKAGSIFSTDVFLNPDPETNNKLRDTGILAVEMEAAGLYALAMRKHKKALAILSISDHIFKGEILTPQEIRESFTDMMEIALETAWRFTD